MVFVFAVMYLVLRYRPRWVRGLVSASIGGTGRERVDKDIGADEIWDGWPMLQRLHVRSYSGGVDATQALRQQEEIQQEVARLGAVIERQATDLAPAQGYETRINDLTTQMDESREIMERHVRERDGRAEDPFTDDSVHTGPPSYRSRSSQSSGLVQPQSAEL